MSRPAYIEIDAVAYQENIQIVRHLAPNQIIMAVVKANAYGHGTKKLSNAINTADAAGVCCIEEAMQLRCDINFTKPIMLMEGVFSIEELPLAAAQNFHVVIHHLSQIKLLKQAKLEKVIKVWLKIDTGMHRLGIAPESVEDVMSQLESIDYIQKPIGLMTHFSDADELDSHKTQKQYELFQDITKRYKGPRSLANSAAILAFKSSHADWVRPGIMLYGISPFAHKTGLDFNLKPVMTLHSKLIAVNQIKKNESIGYASTWTCPEDMLVGVVAMGYGDGYPRHAKSGTPVLVNGRRVPLIGRVSMDMITVDLRSLPQAQVGDPVVLWGRGLPIEIIAQYSNTIAYELACNISQRAYPRK